MPESPSTRDILILTALKLFAEKGYNCTSVSDILAQADVHSGSLYHHFETKQSLLLAVLEKYRDEIQTMLIEPACRGVQDPIGRIFALLARYRQLLKKTDCNYGCPIGSLALEIHEPDPPVRKLLAANFDRWTSFVESCFKAGRRQLPPKTDTGALATFVLTTMEGGVMLSRTARSLKPFDAAVATLKDYVTRLQSMACPPTKK
jgi:AcrR family transcriptional regulator